MTPLTIKMSMFQNSTFSLQRMSDCSDPEDEIIETTSSAPPRAQAAAHGGCQARQMRPKVPEGAKNWPAIYPIYLNKFRTRQQVGFLFFINSSVD